MKTNKDLSKGSKDMTTAKGMHGSKGQGGSEFDREKLTDRFERSEKTEKREEKLSGTGQGRAMGASTDKSVSGATPRYSGSEQERSEPGKAEREGRDL